MVCIVQESKKKRTYTHTYTSLFLDKDEMFLEKNWKYLEKKKTVRQIPQQ